MRAERPENYVSTTIIDTAGPFLRAMADTLPSEYNRALRSIGYFLQQEIKAGMRNASPGGERWAPMSPITGAIRRIRRGRNYAKPGGRLAQLIRYNHDPAGKVLAVGWIDKRVAKLAVPFQAGSDTATTGRQRRLFNILGTKSRTVRLAQKISIPARPAIEPVYQANRAEIPARMTRRIAELIAKTANKNIAKIIK